MSHSGATFTVFIGITTYVTAFLADEDIMLYHVVMKFCRKEPIRDKVRK